jgi:hypothetical protein
MIDEGELDNELYYLNISNKAFIAGTIEQDKLWH